MSLLQRTSSTAFTKGSVFDAHGRQCAHATGTFRHARRGGVVPAEAEPAGAIATD